MELKAIAIGLKGGIISSLCCVGPLVLVFLGIGSVSGALALTQYRPYFIVLSLAFMAAATWHHMNRSCDGGACKLGKKRFIVTTLAVYAIVLVVLLYAVVPVLAPAVFSSSTPETVGASENVKQIKLNIDNMTCPSCPEIVENSMRQEEGILEVDVNYKESSATVLYDSDLITEEEVVNVVPKPYTAQIIK